MNSRLLVVLTAAAIGIPSCAGERPIVDQVQTNIISKSVFSGEWYYTRTVVDSDESGGWFSFVGDQTFDMAYYNEDYPELPPVARIRWVVTEDNLLGFRAQEIIAGGNADAQDPNFLGEPIASFAIEKHLDLVRKFNASTGEELNVEAEDTSSRRWYEREYIRVNWSSADLSTYYPFGYGLGIGMESSQFYDSNSENPGYRPESRAMSCGADDAREDCDDEDARFHGDYEQGEVYYLSFVSEEIWSPGRYCLFYGMCSSARLAVRTSFRKASPEHEYTTLNYPNNRWENFGIIRIPQQTYSRGGLDDPNEGYSNSYGLTDYVNLYGTRHNIWQRHWQRDVGTGEFLRDEVGEKIPLSHAEMWDWANVRPVDYYMVKDIPAHLIRPSMLVFEQWNALFARMWRIENDPAAVNDDTPIDCRVVGAEPPTGNDVGSFDTWDGDLNLRMEGTECIFRLHVNPCDVPVPEGDEAQECFELGDIRFHFYNIIRQNRVPFSGVSLPQADPDTGELLTANINFVLQTLPGISTGAIQTIRANEGYDDDLGIITGEDIRQYAENSGRVIYPVVAAPSGAYTEHGGGAGAEGAEGGGEGAGDENQWDGAGFQAPISMESIPGQGGTLHDRIVARVMEVLPTVRQLGGVEGQAALMNGRWDAIPEAYPTFERELMEGLLGGFGEVPLMNSELAGLFEPMPQTDLDTTTSGLEEEVLDVISPFRNNVTETFNPPAMQRQRQLMALNFDFFPMTEWSDQSLNAVVDKYGTCESWAWDDPCVANFAMQMQQDTIRFIMLHELGHSVGMHHNFGGSTDHVNYPDAWHGIVRDLPLPKPDPITACEDRDGRTFDCVDCDGDDVFDRENFDCDDNSVIDADEQALWRARFHQIRQARKDAGADLIQLSTVMEYPGEWYQWQGGLGKYDYAAIAHSYANQIEAFVGDPRIDRDDFDIQPARDDGTQFDRAIWHYYVGGEHCTIDTDCPANRTVEGFENQAVTQRCLPNPRYVHQIDASRPCNPESDEDCVCSGFEEDFRDATFYGVDCDGDGSINGDADENFDCDGDEQTDHIPVSYAFCANDRLDDISWCNVYDTGPSFRDVVLNLMESYDRTYPFGNFRRHRAGFRGNMFGWYRVFPVFAKIFQHFYYRLIYENGFIARDGGFGFDDQFLASFDTMNFLASVVARPDVGSYALDTTRDSADRSVLIQVSDEVDADDATVDVPFGAGKYLWSQYQDHHNGYYMMERHGSHLDKLYAIRALTARDWGLNYRYDERFFINYHTLFPSEMIQIFGGLIADDPDRFGARYNPDEETVEFVDYSRGTGPLFGRWENCLAPAHEVYDTVGGVPGGTVMPSFDDAISLTTRNFALMSALAEFPVYFDPTFQMQLRVCVEGTSNCVDVPESDPGDGRALVEGTDFIRYRSDQSHKTYVSYETDGLPEFACDEPSVGFALLAQMNGDQDELAAQQAPPVGVEPDEAAIRRIQQRIQGNESFLETLIYLQERLGIAF